MAVQRCSRSVPKINAFDAAAGRTVEIWHGDLFAEQINVDLLVISAKQNFYEPVPGTMVKVLEDRCKIKVGSLPRELDLMGLPTIRGWVSTELQQLPEPPQWPPNSQTRFQRLVVIETPWPLDAEANKGMVFEQLFRLLALLPLHGIDYSSVSTPLLNTGEQQQPPDSLFPAILDAVEGGFRHLPDLRQFMIVDLKQDALSRLSQQIDERLHRTPLQKTVLSIEDAYQPLIKGLLTSIDDFQRRNQELLQGHMEVRENLAVLLHELEGQKVTPVTLGSSARKLLEALVQSRLRSEDVGQGLFRQVKLLSSDISAWSGNAMHTVRIFGNWMCHATLGVETEARPRQDVSEDDIVAMLLALRRVLDDYPWQPTYSRRPEASRRQHQGKTTKPIEHLKSSKSIENTCS
jgi:hypothetical protein